MRNMGDLLALYCVLLFTDDVHSFCCHDVALLSQGSTSYTLYQL